MKALRQRKIIELVESSDIETQEELASRLRDCGYDVTQATVSRDIRELKLDKVPGSRGRAKYAALKEYDSTAGKKYIGALNEAVLSIEAAGNIIVIKTASGMAMAVASVVDSMKIDGIMGCIAGDDTIMCVVKSASEAVTVTNELSVRLNDYGGYGK
ncbi:MAG: arginine repressor [Lachnospiraceae bacterium]|nr:arginine repressor [Lachnospiraceae bacterium]